MGRQLSITNAKSPNKGGRPVNQSRKNNQLPTLYVITGKVHYRGKSPPTPPPPHTHNCYRYVLGDYFVYI